MILETIVVGNLMVNCYLVGDANELMVVDPGDEAEKIFEIIWENKYHVKYIVLTHCHYDHIGGVRFLKEKTGANIVVCKHEKQNYLTPSINLSAHFGQTQAPPQPDMLVDDGDVITSGSYEFTVIHTPGHTGGGMCLLYRDILISGDTLFQDGMGRADLPTGNLRVLVNSIKNKLFILEDTVKVYPGHGASTNIAHEKKYNEVYEWERYCDESE